MEIYSKFEPASMHDTFPFSWKKADGCYVWDLEDKKYLDFTSGIFVSNVGHANKTISKYIKKQLDKKLWFSFTFPSLARKDFIDELISMCPPYLQKCCVFSDGSIANEAALKLAKAYTGKKRILSCSGSYHGNTNYLMNLSEPKLKFPREGDSFPKDIDSNDLAAIILEGYQGWSAYFYPKNYIKDLEKWCKDNGVLIIMDEIQSGFGRTGKLFCYYHYDIEPDIVTFGKGASSSLPLSGVLGSNKIMDSLNGKELISNTHSGNCLVMAAGLGSLKALQKIDLDEVCDKGFFLKKMLEQLKLRHPTLIREISGKGLLAAIHFYNKDLCDKVTYKSIINGVMLVRTRKGSIKLGPPLIITAKQIKRGIDIIEKSIDECVKLDT